MPIYEYACTNCDHSLDALQKISDEPLRDCPECGKPALRRKISAPRFRLKGSGWYETDFKKDNQRNVLKADSDTPSSDKADSKSDKEKPAKTASKKESKSASKADVK